MATANAAEAKRLAQQVFQGADKNNNGFLTKTELRKYFKNHPAEKNRILGSDFKWNEFFTNMDKDGDKKFDVNEFTNFIVSSSKLAVTKKEEAAEPNAAPTAANTGPWLFVMYHIACSSLLVELDDNFEKPRGYFCLNFFC